MDVAHSKMFGLALWGAVFGLGTGAWFTYFRLKERSPRPFSVMLAATIGGYGAALISAVLYEQPLFISCVPTWNVLEAGGFAGLCGSGVIGLVEEGAKLLPTFLIVLAVGKHIERTQDAIFIAACAGVGFAAAENMMLLQSGLPHLDALARAIASPVTHALFAAPWGLGLGRLIRRRQVTPLLLGFAASVCAHGAYDLLLASPKVPHAVAAVEVLALWVWMLLRTAPKVLAQMPVPRPSRAG